MWDCPKSPRHQAAIDNLKLDHDRQIARATERPQSCAGSKPLRKHLRNTK